MQQAAKQWRRADLPDNTCRGLSYQWDVQATVLRIAASMRERSFLVWVDTEMMSGSTLDAMAAAVENAHCVLVCVTERYKKSANCRLEGTCECWHAACFAGACSTCGR